LLQEETAAIRRVVAGDDIAAPVAVEITCGESVDLGT
jgi:hypothetical protein